MDVIIFALISIRSSLLIPGFLANPAVTITTSESFRDDKLLDPEKVEAIPSTEEACERSSAFPCGTPLIMSMRTTSPRLLSPTNRAKVPPIFPAPTRAILFLFNFCSFYLIKILQIENLLVCRY